MRYLNGTVLDERTVRVDHDWGFVEGRQWGRGRSGGQVRRTAKGQHLSDVWPIIAYKIRLMYQVDRATTKLGLNETNLSAAPSTCPLALKP